MMNRGMICSKPFRFIEIIPNGNAYPCCPGWTLNGGFTFGNIYKNNFSDIWNGEEAQEFRRTILDGRYKYCNLSKCMAYHDNTEMNENEQIFFEKAEIKDRYKEVMDAYPLKVSLGHDPQCNAACTICREHKIINSAEKVKELNSMIDPVFLPMLKGAKVVLGNFNGELFASSHYRTLVKSIIVKYPDIKFIIVTNGQLCDKQNCDELGITDKIENIRVSLNATTKKTHFKMMGNLDFNRILKNIEWLSSLKRAGKINRLRLSTVICSYNYKEINDFIKLAQKLDADISLSKYEPNNPALDRCYKKLAVFEKSHSDYNKFVKIINKVRNRLHIDDHFFLALGFRNLKLLTTLEWLEYKLKGEQYHGPKYF